MSLSGPESGRLPRCSAIRSTIATLGALLAKASKATTSDAAVRLSAMIETSNPYLSIDGGSGDYAKNVASNARDDAAFAYGEEAGRKARREADERLREAHDALTDVRTELARIKGDLGSEKAFRAAAERDHEKTKAEAEALAAEALKALALREALKGLLADDED